MEMAREIETMRMEMEMKRTEMILKLTEGKPICWLEVFVFMYVFLL